MKLTYSARLIGFVDDCALVVATKYEGTLMTIADTALQLIVNWILDLAPEKTEAVLLTTQKKIQPIYFPVDKMEVHISSSNYISRSVDGHQANFC